MTRYCPRIFIDKKTDRQKYEFKEHFKEGKQKRLVDMCEVSPKMEKQGSFLFLVFGVTCSSTCIVLSNSFLFINIISDFPEIQGF